MLKKIVVKNLYHKKLSFESLLGRPFSMEGKEIRTVDFDMGMTLLQSTFVERVDKEPDIKIKTEGIVKDKEKEYNYKLKPESIVKDKKLTKKGREAIVKD